jgi:hypothetical protein
VSGLVAVRAAARGHRIASSHTRCVHQGPNAVTAWHHLGIGAADAATVAVLIGPSDIHAVQPIARVDHSDQVSDTTTTASGAVRLAAMSSRAIQRRWTSGVAPAGRTRYNGRVSSTDAPGIKQALHGPPDSLRQPANTPVPVWDGFHRAYRDVSS